MGVCINNQESRGICVKHRYLDQILNLLIRYMFDINQATSSDTIGRHITKVSDLLSLPRAWKRRRLVELLASPWPLSMFSTSQSSYADGECKRYQSTLIKNQPILALDPVLNKRMVIYQMIRTVLKMSSPLRT
ncbi:hypothetical protein F5H01DRAFT_364102 [Linnemannia elongata]|nr:hypothetical protein F5H01DRAFT_364102 [Linnemannia elongata]